MIGILIVTHSNLGDALIEAAEFITGSRPDDLVSVSIDLNESADKLRKTESEIKQMGGDACHYACDLNDMEEIDKLVKQVLTDHLHVDILINNAGRSIRRSLRLSFDRFHDFERTMQLNYYGALRLIMGLAPSMLKRREGHIINISSIHEDWPMPGNTPYCLSKGGMRMLTRNAGVELAPHGITVVGVGPGAVATPINVETMQDPELMAQLNAAIPLGRLATPQEIANLVVWLASDQASYVTATTFIVDGGMMQFSPGL